MSSDHHHIVSDFKSAWWQAGE